MQKKLGPFASVRRREREEELTLFHEVRRREHERKSNAIHPLPPHDADLAGTPDYSIQHHEASSASKMTLCYASSNPVVIESLPSDLTERSDDLLSAELGKNDYDWLLTPPGTPSYKHSNHNSASDHSDFLSRGEPLSLVQSLAAIKTSRFSSTKMEPNLMKDGPTVLKNSELASRKGQNGVYGSNGLSAGSSMFSTNSMTASSSKKTPLTPRSGSASRPTSPAKRTLASSAHTSNPSIPASKSKHSSAPGSHPTTPTSRYTASKGGGNSVFSSSTPTRKTGPSSPAMASIKRLSPSPTQNQPLSAGVSRSSSVNKSRPQPSRSAPSSRGNSPRGSPHDWPQAFSSNSQSVTTTPTPNSYLSSNLTTPTSLNQRASGVGSSPRPGATSSTRQALFPSSNQLETSMDIQKKARSPSFTRGKCALLKMDRQTSSGSIMSRSSIQLDKSKGDSMTVSIKMEDKMIHTMRPLGSSVLSDTTCSGVQAKYPLEKYTSLTTNGDHGFSKHASGGSLDMAMEHVSLHRDASNVFCPPSISKPVHSLWSTRNVVAQDCSNSAFIAENSKMKVDVKVIASHGQGGGKQSEELKYRSDFKVLLADQTDILSSFVKDDNMDNWLDSPVYMNEGPDLMKIFDQGLGKFGSCESPLVCPHGGGAVTCDLCSVKLRLQMLNEKSKASFGANSQILSEA